MTDPDRSKRAPRIDYAQLHRTGERVEIEPANDVSLYVPVHNDTTAELNTHITSHNDSVESTSIDSATTQKDLVFTQTGIVVSPQSDIVVNKSDCVASHQTDLVSNQIGFVTPQTDIVNSHSDVPLHNDVATLTDKIPHADITSHIDQVVVHSDLVSLHEHNVSHSSPAAVNHTLQFINDRQTSNHSQDHTSLASPIADITPEAVDSSPETSQVAEMADVAATLKVEFNTITEDIADFFDENPVAEVCQTVEDHDLVNKEVEQLRSSYRGKHNQLKVALDDAEYETDFKQAYEGNITKFKEYIKQVKESRRKLRNGEEETFKEKASIQAKKFHFLDSEVTKKITRLEKIFTLTTDQWNSKDDNEIEQRRKDLLERGKEIQSLLPAIKELMDYSPGVQGGSKAVSLRELSFATLSSLRDKYEKELEEEYRKRQIEQKKTFNKSKLNVKIPQFKGYDSEEDFYTFRSKFEKVHLTDTPRHLLPEVLKNNFLENPALAVVNDLDDIDMIWARLKESFGDPKLMLSKKVNKLNEIQLNSRHRNSSNIADAFSKLINTMKDILQLANSHNLQSHLFYGDTFDRIYRMMGEGRLRKFLSQDSLPDEGLPLWQELTKFLEKEMKVYQKTALVMGTRSDINDDDSKDPKDKDKRNQKAGRTPRDGGGPPFQNNHLQNKNPDPCHICGVADHVATSGPGGTKLVQYFACEKFATMTNKERFTVLRTKGLCFQCLFPGASHESGKHKEGRCQRDFTCKHADHDKYTKKKHVLVCDEHKDDDANKKVLEDFKKRCIMRPKQVDSLPDYSKNINIHHQTILKHSVSPENAAKSSDEWPSLSDEDEAVYILQTIVVDGVSFRLFYDNGCRHFTARHGALLQLKDQHKFLRLKGPITVGGVMGMSAVTPHGIWSVKLPLGNGELAHMTGTCLDVITEEFPEYPLGQIEKDLRAEFSKTGRSLNLLPNLPPKVGGNTDFMIGAKYSRYFPEEVFRAPSGLTIYKSQFQNPDGSFGVVGGPHPVIKEIEARFHGHDLHHFFSSQLKIFLNGYSVNSDLGLLGYKCAINEFDSDSCEEEVIAATDSVHHVNSVQQKLRKFEEAEQVGSEIQYRCIKCRNCGDCKDHAHSTLSIKEEIEQHQIEESVTVDIKKQETVATLPFMADPAVKLSPNVHIARKMYNRVVARLSKSEEKRQAALQSEAKLQEAGFVQWVKDLPPDLQKLLKESPIQNFLPWNVVFKENSISTPCRLTFNGSMPTDTGYSLNDILAKGQNTLSKLLEIFLRWRTHHVAFHSDVAKMYNTLKLDPNDWCYQRYLFQESLDPDKEPEEKVLVTVTYGVKSSGNQASAGLRSTSAIFKEEFPEVNSIVGEDTYMDDTMGGEETVQLADQRCDEIELVLNQGGFRIKGFTVSGRDPLESLSSDGVTVSVSGHKWFSKDDRISLESKEVNFAKKVRGKVSGVITEVPDKLTRRMCCSKVGEVFDFTGILTPITAPWKLDLRDIKHLKWDDTIPENLRPLWEENFKLMSAVRNITYQRAVVPVDAANLDINTLDFGDASKVLVCVAIYVRFMRKCGKFSCQLLFAKSRLVPEGTTQPRAEMYAAVVNTHCGQVVKSALSKHHSGSIKFSDSQITLNWISNDARAIKDEWVRNRCIEIRRFTSPDSWRFVESEDMIADKGTRRGTSIVEVDCDSEWINGFAWMVEEEEQFPAVTIAEINAKGSEPSLPNSEEPDLVFLTKSSPEEVQKRREEIGLRYKFSQYLIDPNLHRFRDVVRLLALWYHYVGVLQKRIKDPARVPIVLEGKDPVVPGDTFILSASDIKKSEDYFFRLATLEVKHFLKPQVYENISKERDGILYYTGRILPEDHVSVVGGLTDAMLDLCATTFCVPLVDKFSPLAFSIVNEVHWHDEDVAHRGVETTWRYVLKQAYIIQGRSLVKRFRTSCERCRYLAKRTLDVSMGPVSPYNITIAPAFYISQVDLAGPFLAYDTHNKRKTIKLWMAVFCCTTTSATKIKIMDSYSTVSFIQAFSRFACDVGFPFKMLADQGSQLVKGCQSAVFSFTDIKFRLHRDSHVELDVCPVGGHNMHGKVERRIRHIKESVMYVSNEKLSVLQWETLCSSIANSVNNLPLALGDFKSDFEVMDLITPNRLLLGRNNNRCPIGPVVLDTYDRILENNKNIYNSWFENWLLCHVPKLMEQPKWFRDDRHVQKGDIVLLLKHESDISSEYRYGIIDSVEVSRDGKIRGAYVRYRNSDSNTDQTSYRAVRSLVVIHSVDEVNVMQEIGEIAINVDAESRRQHARQ